MAFTNQGKGHFVFYWIEVRRGMLKRRIGSVSMEELIKRNKEELLRDKQELEKIEKRLDDKHVTTVK